MIPGIKFNEAELRADYPNGSRITLFGADNPDSLRGLVLWGVVFDEYSQQPSNIFSEIIRPALADHKGYAVWIGTPKGKNEFYRLYEAAQGDSAWYRLLLKASESGIIPAEELADAKKLMSDDEYNQEFECSFVSALKGAYYADQLAKAREERRIGNVPYDPTLPVDTWWDLGVGDSMAIGFFQSIGNEWRLIDSYSSSGEGLDYYFKLLKDKGYLYRNHFAPHDIEVRELSSGKSRRNIASGLGINFQIAPNLPVDDGINAARMRFPTLWIDEQKNQQFLDAVSQYRKEWDDKRGEFKNKPLHDWTSHYADMLRYWAVTNEQNQDFDFEIKYTDW